MLLAFFIQCHRNTAHGMYVSMGIQCNGLVLSAIWRTENGFCSFITVEYGPRLEACMRHTHMYCQNSNVPEIGPT